MGRPVKKPMAAIHQPAPLRVPRPDHGPIEITLCGSVYQYTEPRNRLDHDVLRGHVMAAFSKMVGSVGDSVNMYATRVSEAEDANEEAARIQSEITQGQQLSQVAGFYLAMHEIFNTVVFGLQISTRQAAYLRDNYDTQEMIAAFSVIAGAVMRPFSGTPRGTKQAVNPMTDLMNTDLPTT
jgi:hypothetical protein